MIAVVEALSIDKPPGIHVRAEGALPAKGGARRMFVETGEHFDVGERVRVEVAADEVTAHVIERLPPVPKPAPPPPPRVIQAGPDAERRIAERMIQLAAMRSAGEEVARHAARRDAVARAGLVLRFALDPGFDDAYGQAPDVAQALATLTRGAR